MQFLMMVKLLVIRIPAGLLQQVQENIAMLVGMCLFVGLNYIGQRFFVFKGNRNSEQQENNP